MRTIDVDELKKRLGIADNCDNCSDKMRSYCDGNPSFALTCELICKAPTVDAVQVVRCKECKHWVRNPQGSIAMINWGLCNERFGGWHIEYWYCADGERREEDERRANSNH